MHHDRPHLSGISSFSSHGPAADALALVGALLSLAPLLVDFLPALQPYIPPGHMGVYTAAIAVVTFVARRRSVRQ